MGSYLFGILRQSVKIPGGGNSPLADEFRVLHIGFDFPGGYDVNVLKMRISSTKLILKSVLSRLHPLHSVKALFFRQKLFARFI
jgi:hypothetical protein